MPEVSRDLESLLNQLTYHTHGWGFHNFYNRSFQHYANDSKCLDLVGIHSLDLI